MSSPACKFALSIAAAWSLAGCRPACGPVTLETAGVEPGVRYDDLAAVLDRAVRSNGLADADALKTVADQLDAQLRRLAVTGPTATPRLLPSREDVLAYWYNASAAWSMKLLLLERCPKEIDANHYRDRPVPIDGRQMTLRGIGAILAEDEDFRTAVAAPGATLQDARLPTRPFEPAGIRARIAERFAGFLDDPKRFVIDVPHQQIRVPEVLWQFRERLIADHNRRYATQAATLTTALLALVTGPPHRRLQDAIGYPCKPARPGLLVADAEED